MFHDTADPSHYWAADPLGETLIRDAESRTISAENPTGLPGMGCLAEPERGNPAHELGRGWKARPRVTVAPGETLTLGEMEGRGVIGRIWVTFTDEDNFSKLGIIRGYFDRSPVPSFRCPIGSFFNCAWGRYAQVSSAYAAVNPRLGLECYHLMPFRREFRIELENTGSHPAHVYYSIDLELVRDVPRNAGYFGAQYHLSNPATEGVHTVLDVKGRGHWKGFYAGWRSNEFNWWGEGMWLVYPDRRDDPVRVERPSLHGRVGRALAAVEEGGATQVWPGTEDMVGGAFDFIDPATGDYRPYSNPYTGMVQYPARGYKDSSRCFGLYRWLRPPVHFDGSLLVVNQVLGVRHSDGMFAKRCDSVVTTSVVYTRDLPEEQPPLPSRSDLERL
jgi:hypothetical protein